MKLYRPLWIRDIIIILLLIVSSTAVFHAFNIDIAVEQIFYKNGQWVLQENKIVRALYDYGPWPSFITVIGAIIAFTVSYFKRSIKKYRIYLIYLTLVLLLGPGLIVNGILKLQCGRPRPVEIKEFGGKKDFLPVLVKGKSKMGRSFTCGHCSSGYFFVAFYFIFKRKKFWLSVVLLLIGIIYGSAIGVARMATGGHFPSDMFWSFFVVFSTALVIYYFLLKIPQIEDSL
ncbi:MAG: phosphatase PAP2 family protein [Candidatus Magnetoovum sp. WYHC-5]|nr:phosphatase PAP2 family protein [Candidatus Magnetoovum sp. WYHC-5]